LLCKVFHENKKLNLELENASFEITTLRSVHEDMSVKPCDNCTMIMVNYADLWLIHSHVASLLDSGRLKLRELKTRSTLLGEDSRASLSQRVVELEAENSQFKATIVESTDMISVLQRVVGNGVEDYNPLMEGNKSLLAECNDFHHHCEDLKVELVGVRSDAKKRIADLETRVMSGEAHSVDVAAAGEEHLRDFEDGLIRYLADLCAFYVHNTQTIGGLCSPMPEGEPSTADYLCWLSTEISGLLDMLAALMRISLLLQLKVFS
jgi:hypothetical protein